MKSTRYKKHTEGIGAVRGQLGLSQDEFAAILQISRGALVMNEHRKRTLNGPALLKVALLEIKLAGTMAFHTTQQELHPAEGAITKESIDKAGLLLVRESQCRSQVSKLLVKLAAVTAIYKRTRHWLLIIDNSLSESNFTLDNEAQWWKMQRYTAIAKLATCDAGVQLLLQSKIDLLTGEAELNKKTRLQLTGN